ncbi:MAG TPA: hypothetical protein VFB65_19350 [Pyrinomonadaceae bacterium]|nr:hypothetical protein [Pyrinomonadaceae bacterium]
MTNDYMAPEVIEIGEAEALILGAKMLPDVDDNGEATMPDESLDD